MNQKLAHAYSRRLRDYYFELLNSQQPAQNGAIESLGSLGALLSEIDTLPSPEKEKQFVQGVFRLSDIPLRRAA